MKKIVCILTIYMSLSNMACAPKAIMPRQLPKLEIEKVEPYSIDLSNIKKPDPIKPIFVDEEFNETNVDDAKYIVLLPSDYAKIASVLKLAKAYKEIIKEQEILINSKIDTINALREYLELERMKTQEYVNLWADAETAYRREQYYHNLDNVINKGSFVTLALGIIVAIIAL